MGAAQHKSVENTKMETLPYQDSTPPRDQCLPKRLLPFDPRSPSDNIARTPIVVDKTPDTLLELDPRSPTLGVERTPLSLLLSKNIRTNPNIQLELETAPPPVTTDDVAPLCLPEETGDAEMLTPQKPDSSEFGCFQYQDIPDIDADDASPLLEKGVMPFPRGNVEPTPMQTKAVSCPKQLFPISTSQSSSPTPKQTALSRPSLGLVAIDTNSPRSLLQTKQRRQVTKSVGGGRGRRHFVDKENVAH